MTSPDPMSRNDAISAASFREFEHAGWQMVADPYHDYFASLTVQTVDALLDAVGLAASNSLLDIATGPGYVAAAAAARGAIVTGVDFSSVMVDKARQSYPAIDFREGDAEALKFDQGSFDVAVMNFGLLHLNYPEQALVEAHRVLRPAGRFAFTVWAAPEEARAFGIVLKAIEQHGNLSAPLPPGPPFFRFSDRAEAERVLLEAGFQKPALRTVSMTWHLPAAEDLFNAFCRGTPRTGGLLRAQSPADLEAIANAVTTAAENYRTGHGIQIPMASLVVSGIK